MTIMLSVGARNSFLSAGLATRFDGGQGRLTFYNGTDPTNPDAAISGTVLATVALPSDVFGSAASGTITANAITPVTGSSEGTATFAVLHRADETALGSAAAAGDARIIFTNITTIGGGGEVEMGSTTITTAPDGVEIESFTLTCPSGV